MQYLHPASATPHRDCHGAIPATPPCSCLPGASTPDLARTARA